MSTIVRAAGVLLALFLVTSLAPPSEAAASRCPYASTQTTDGCSSAAATGQTQHAGFFNGYAAQSGQGLYRVRPSWNVAGVDYAVGFSSPFNKLMDIRRSHPAGCGFRAYGATTALVCTGSGALVISGYRFDMHGGTWLLIQSANYTSARIENDYFLNGSGTDRVGGALIVVSALDGDLTIANTTIDGAGRTNTQGLWYLVEDGRGGSQRDIFEYNAMFRVPQKGIGTGPCGDTYIKYNYFEELELSASHGEFTIDGNTACTKDVLDVSYNTMLLTAGVARTGAGGITTLMFLSAGNTSRSWNHILASNNTLVANNIGNPLVAPGVGAAEASTVIEEGGGSVYSEMTYSNNFIDATGALFCYYPSVPRPTKTIMSGNTNLLDGSPIDTYLPSSCFGKNISGIYYTGG